jgi:hypothetical protein
MLARQPGLALDQVEFEPADAQHGIGGVFAAPTQQDFDPHSQFIGRKRFDHIIIAAGAQSGDAMADIAHRTQQQDGGGDLFGTQPSEQSQPVHVGQQAVKRDHVEAFGLRTGQPFAPGFGMPGGIVRFGKSAQDDGCNRGIILDNQHIDHPFSLNCMAPCAKVACLRPSALPSISAWSSRA